jgi:site-specific recombinase XerD
MQQMREELVRRNYAESTMRSYLGTVEDFRGYFQKRLDHMEPAHIRRYQVHLLEERKLGVGTVINHVAALRFLYVKTLKRREMKQDLPYPKHERPLPVVLSVEEVTRLIESVRNLFHLCAAKCLSAEQCKRPRYRFKQLPSSYQAATVQL